MDNCPISKVRYVIERPYDLRPAGFPKSHRALFLAAFSFAHARIASTNRIASADSVRSLAQLRPTERDAPASAKRTEFSKPARFSTEINCNGSSAMQSVLTTIAFSAAIELVETHCVGHGTPATMNSASSWRRYALSSFGRTHRAP